MTTPPLSRVPALLVMVMVLALGQPVASLAQVTQLQVNRLEQDIRDLRRMLDAQQRRIEELERAAGKTAVPRTTGVAKSPSPRAAPAAASDAPWLAAANWERVRPGLAELDVVALLGPPSSMRVSDDGRQRTLLYALEIGTSGFLAGNVVLEQGRVVTVERPRLR